MNRADWQKVVFLAGAAVAFVLISLPVHWLIDVPQVEAILYVLAAFFVVAAAASPFLSRAVNELERRHEAFIQGEDESIHHATASMTGNPALKNLILFNYRMMSRFIDAALSQAKASYVFSAAACSAGLLILLTGTVALVTAHGLTAQLTAGGLTAIGTVLSGYIGHTFIKTFRITAQQMSFYYGQPVVHCYLLHAEWLAERATQHDTAEARAFDQQLITATIQAGLDAQHRLLDLIEHDQAPEPAASGASLNGFVSSATTAQRG